MCFLDKLTIVSIGFVLGMITTSGVMLNKPETMNYPIVNNDLNGIFTGSTQEVSLNEQELKCDGQTKPGDVMFKGMSDLMMDKSSLKVVYSNDNKQERFVTGY